MSPKASTAEVLQIDDREVRISSPDKVVFPEAGLSKLDVVRYYLAVAEGALRGAGGRPMVLKRFVKGIDQEAFFQKRAPEKRPDWIETATLHYATGNSAEEVGPAEKPPKSSDGSGRRASTMPLIEIARAETKPEALEGLERWKARHSDVAALLHPADVLVDGMRGSSSLWYRIRVNLQHVPVAQRPEQEPLEIDYDPWAGKEWNRQ